MCNVCNAFRPHLNECEYTEFLTAPNEFMAGTGPVVVMGAQVNESGDAAGGTSTTASMEVGDYYHGELQTNNDSDWIAVDLVAGQEYTIAIAGTGALGTSNDDPYLRIRDASGNLLFEDDDDGPGRYSDHTFTATTTGTYYIDVQSWNNSDSGTYGVSVTEGNRASFDAIMGAGALLRPDGAWTATAGTGATVSWAIRSSGDDGNGFIALSSQQRAAAQDVMEYLDGISGLDLNQVSPNGTSNNATILIAAYSANDGSGAYAYLPGANGGDTSFGSQQGDVWLNNNAGSTTNLQIGTYEYLVMLHEIGHAIGLAHPGDYNAGGGGPITYNNNAQFIQDSEQYTVMSYFDGTNTGASSGLGYPDTFMLYDLLAIHQLYGADTSYHSGNTVYGFNSTEANTAYDFAFNTTPYLSIYDGNGEDTIDLSGYSMAQMLDLNEGAFSDIGGYIGNMSIAYGATIENAIGGSGNDTIVGNDADNEVNGGSGTDVFQMDMNLADATITEVAGGYQVVSAEGTDVLTNVEFIQFNDQLYDLSSTTPPPPPPPSGPTTGNDNLTGTSSADTVDLLAGNDTYDGLGGNDSILGNAGNDTITGGLGDDTINGGANTDVAVIGVDFADATITETASGYQIVSSQGTDQLIDVEFIQFNDQLYDLSTFTPPPPPPSGATPGNDNLSGTTANDVIDLLGGDDVYDAGNGNDDVFGNSGNDTLNGGEGDDTLRGGTGADAHIGGAGTDWADYSDIGNPGVRADLQNSANNAKGAVGDTYDSIENLIGSDWSDNLRGDGGNNEIHGGRNVDWIFGRAGNDYLVGGIGNDVLIGGSGIDTLDGGENLDRAQYFSQVTVDLADTSLNTGVAAGDVFISIEDLAGSKFNDFLYGDENANRLFGKAADDHLDTRAGDDYLNGGLGKDTLIGGADDDILRGGPAADTFVFDDGNDVIQDMRFAHNDRIELDGAALGITGMSAADVVSTYGEDSSGMAVLDFGGGNTLTLENLTTLDGLESYIAVV